MGTPIDVRRRERPSGVYTDDSDFGERTIRGAGMIERGFSLRGKDEGLAKGMLGYNWHDDGSPESSRITLGWKAFECTFTQSREGRGGQTENEGIGMFPGKRRRSSAQR